MRTLEKHKEMFDDWKKQLRLTKEVSVGLIWMRGSSSSSSRLHSAPEVWPMLLCRRWPSAKARGRLGLAGLRLGPRGPPARLWRDHCRAALAPIQPSRASDGHSILSIVPTYLLTFLCKKHFKYIHLFKEVHT